MKLTNEQIARAMELRVMGLYWREIAKQLNVNRTTIIKAVKRAEDKGVE